MDGIEKFVVFPGMDFRRTLLIDEFNVAFKNIAASYLKVGGESMSAIRFQTT